MDIKDIVHVIETKKRIEQITDKAVLNAELKEEIEYLRKKGYSDENIIEAFKNDIVLEAQGNQIMLDRTKQIEELIKKILEEQNGMQLEHWH